MKTWLPASQMSPPSTVPGAAMRAGSGKNERSASSIAGDLALAARRARAASGSRRRPVRIAVSSTNVRVGMARIRRQPRQREAAVLERLAVALVLRERRLEVGRPEIDGRQAVGEVRRGRADDGAAKMIARH